MKKTLLILPLLAFGLSACETPEQNAVALGLGGAAIGAAVSGEDDRLTGALTGAALGVGASLLIGRSTQQGQCVYRDSRGQQFIAPC